MRHNLLLQTFELNINLDESWNMLHQKELTEYFLLPCLNKITNPTMK